ncbi:hypothetical protein EN943_37090, partial [Mesorhizobium sp. M7A.F.Ca.US.006.01.1.1]|uniref:amidase family protein n=1 Tax=Mesorhizobium sp. M7A.F.Ca.US.006.01.1.1 TaxID=2496707 RepID=UPI000FD482A2
MAADAHRVSDVNNAHAWTAAEACDAIAQGSSPVALAEALLRHIKKFDPLLNVFVHLDEDVVLEAARIAEAELKRGNRRGPLHGVPVAIKDIIDVCVLSRDL